MTATNDSSKEMVETLNKVKVVDRGISFFLYDLQDTQPNNQNNLVDIRYDKFKYDSISYFINNISAIINPFVVNKKVELKTLFNQIEFFESAFLTNEAFSHSPPFKQPKNPSNQPRYVH